MATQALALSSCLIGTCCQTGPHLLTGAPTPNVGPGSSGAHSSVRQSCGVSPAVHPHICKSSSASCPRQPSHPAMPSSTAGQPSCTLPHSLFQDRIHRVSKLEPIRTRPFLSPSGLKGESYKMDTGGKGPTTASLYHVCRKGVRPVWLTHWTKACLGRRVKQGELYSPSKRGTRKDNGEQIPVGLRKEVATQDSNLSLYLRGTSAQVFSELGTLR